MLRIHTSYSISLVSLPGSQVATKAGESRSLLRLEVGSRSGRAHRSVQDPRAGERKRAVWQEEQREEEVAVTRILRFFCILAKPDILLPIYSIIFVLVLL